METLWAGANARNFLSVIEDLIKEDVYRAVGRKYQINTNNCWATLPDSLKRKTGNNKYTAVSDFIMYIIADKLEGLKDIKAFYNCAVWMNSPVKRGILL